MDDVTKKMALDKAAKMKDKYGFPEYLLNNTRIEEEYAGLELSHGDFWMYTWEINLWAIQKHLKKLRNPVDKEVWSMSVEETNAYYNPTDNAMVFPAGLKSVFCRQNKLLMCFDLFGLKREPYSPSFLVYCVCFIPQK